jgi:hypothetical protein
MIDNVAALFKYAIFYSNPIAGDTPHMHELYGFVTLLVNIFISDLESHAPDHSTDFHARWLKSGPRRSLPGVYWKSNSGWLIPRSLQSLGTPWENAAK